MEAIGISYRVCRTIPGSRTRFEEFHGKTLGLGTVQAGGEPF